MNHWMGQDAQDLVMSWGQPDKTENYGSKKAYIYAKPVYAGDYGTTWQYSTFIVDRMGVIRGWSVRQSTVPVESINVRVLLY